MCFSLEIFSFKNDCFSDLEELVLQERAENTGVSSVVSPAWIPSVEIPGVHSSRELYLKCPIFENDLQQYRRLPIALSASILYFRKIRQTLIASCFSI